MKIAERRQEKNKFSHIEMTSRFKIIHFNLLQTPTWWLVLLITHEEHGNKKLVKSKYRIQEFLQPWVFPTSSELQALLKYLLLSAQETKQKLTKISLT